MKLEPNLLDGNVNELECKLELEDMKRTEECSRWFKNPGMGR